MTAGAALLLDIEGTTTPIDFVQGVLFPYARERCASFLATHWHMAGVAADLLSLAEEHARDVAAGSDPPEWRDAPTSAAAYAAWLMDRDRKATGLKALQGRIWAAGYADGSLIAPMYDDVPRAFERWRAQGRSVAIFSSGSVLAQRLLFAHTQAGDLTGFLSAHFDTTTGAKVSPDSYRRIAATWVRSSSAIVFVSDVAAELDAARSAGLATALCVRSEGPPAVAHHPVLNSFDDWPAC